MPFNFCTLFDSYYLTRGIALYKSLELHCEDFHLYIFAFDNNSYDILKNLNFEHATIISLKSFENDDLLKVKPTRTIAEYCWTCTASSIWYSIHEFKLDHCTYLDADMLFFSSPAPIYEEIGSNSIAITPHNFSKGLKSSEIFGKYCVQFTYFKNDVDGLMALNWWKNSCIEWCYAKMDDGKYGDQKYLDYFEGKFNNVCLIAHIGAGVAPWNISNFEISLSGNEILIALKSSPRKQYPLIFYHYQGLKFVDAVNYIKAEPAVLKIPYSALKYMYDPYINQLILIKNQIEGNASVLNKIVYQRKFIASVRMFFRIKLKSFKLVREIYYLFKKSRFNKPENIGGVLDENSKKILIQINTAGNSGSVGRMVEEIGQIAIQNKWESYIAYGRNEKPAQSRVIKIGSAFVFYLHVLQTRFFDRHGLGSRRATQKLIKTIKKIKPDIIHLHNLHGYYLNIKVLFEYLSESGMSVIWTFYDCWPMTGHCTYFDYVNCQKWKTACSHCPQKKSYPASYFIDRSKKNFLLKKEFFTSKKRMSIISNSQWLENIISQSFFKNYPVHVINSGIDINVFKPRVNITIRARYKIENKFIVLGVANQWVPRKGLSDFLELSKMISSDEIIILIGLSQHQIKNLPTNIIGIPRTESTIELAEWYSTSNVFLNPTWEDNFPTTNLEALACGLPVITYKTGGSVESVSNTTGIIAEKGNIIGLLESIRTIKKNGKVAYSNACRERAIQLYNKNDRYLDYLHLYDSMLNNKEISGA